jgi:hypothetical protein
VSHDFRSATATNQFQFRSAQQFEQTAGGIWASSTRLERFANHRPRLDFASTGYRRRSRAIRRTRSSYASPSAMGSLMTLCAREASDRTAAASSGASHIGFSLRSINISFAPCATNPHEPRPNVEGGSDIPILYHQDNIRSTSVHLRSHLGKIHKSAFPTNPRSSSPALRTANTDVRPLPDIHDQSSLDHLASSQKPS